MPRIAIDRPDDPRIAAYVDVRERDLRGHDGCFLAEGDVVVATVLTRGRALRSLLVSDRRLAATDPLLARVPADVPIYVATQTVMDAVVGFPIHRGLLAVGERGPDHDAAALLAGLGARATVLVAIGITNHDNLGGLFRNAAAFGVDAVLLDAATCDPLYRKAIRVSVGATLVVPFARAGLATDVIATLVAHTFEVIALAPRAAEPIDQLEVGPRRALVVGAEGPGLPAAVLARARAARIDIVPDFDSLNVAVAAGIGLHALRTRP
ncbi:MAG: RNA methyltransferase [Myxococcales bacterium]|nr:RNA methyltransferase [Myxococcales bacterium]